MDDYRSDFKHDFIRFALARGALRFGEFTLKSGRVSPYFFNAGSFSSGAALAKLARFYAAAIIDSGLEFDLLFGPAYKGIPLVAAVSVALAERQVDRPWCFNRKEAKDHGEGGLTVGAPLAGRVLVIDDVISAGTAVGETMALLARHPATAAGVVIALDRQERGAGARSAVQEVEQRYQVPVLSVVSFSDLISFVAGDKALAEHATAVEAYRERYGV